MKTVLIMQLMSLGHLVERQFNFSGTPESERCRIYCDSTLITINRKLQLAHNEDPSEVIGPIVITV